MLQQQRWGKRGKEKNHIHDFSLWDIVSRHARPVPATFLLPPQHPFLACCPLLLGKSPCLDFWSRASHCNAALPHILGLFFRSLCVHVCRSVCECVWECVAQPQLTFINGILPFFKIFADSWAQKMAARRPLDIIRNTHEHTHVCCVCVQWGFDLCYPLCLHPAPATATA